MAAKLYDLAAADEDQRSSAIEPARLPVNSTALTELSAIDPHAEFDARDGEHFSTNFTVSSESIAQQKAGKISPRTRILSVAADLFLRHGIAGVSVEAIAKAAATAEPTLYRHFASKDELVAEYLREAAKRLEVCWAEMLADALLLLFNGACIMAPSVGRIDLSFRFLLLSKAMIAAHAKAPSARRQVQHP
jgi:Bacterial regulatory proteins, tetR family